MLKVILRKFGEWESIHSYMKSSLRHTAKPAFALPTVIISSIVLLMVLLSGLVAASSTSTALRTQYVNKITKEASQAGVARAKTCLSTNNYVPQWANGTPLKSNTDCSGASLVSCTSASTDSRCFVLNSANYQTNFEVTYTLGSDGKVSNINSKGIVTRVRASGSTNTSTADSTIKTGLKKLLASVGATVGPTSYELPIYTGNTATLNDLAPMECAVTTSGEVWCAGYTPLTAPNTLYGKIIAYNGGTMTCSSGCSSNSPQTFVTNLSASGGVFNGLSIVTGQSTDSWTSLFLQY